MEGVLRPSGRGCGPACSRTGHMRVKALKSSGRASDAMNRFSPIIGFGVGRAGSPIFRFDMQLHSTGFHYSHPGSGGGVLLPFIKGVNE